MTDLPSWSDEEIEGVRTLLRQLGAQDADLQVDPQDLPGVGLDVLLRRDASLSARQLAERSQLTVEEIVGIYHELGIGVDDPDEVRFTDVEVDLVDLLRGAVVDQFTPQEGHELIVVTARALRGMADASVSSFVQTIESRLLAEGGSLRDWSEATIGASEMGMRFGASLGPLFNHYLRQAARHQRVAQQGVSSRATMRLAVGFVDLVGFTPLASTLSPEALSQLVGEFESQAFDVANDAGAHIVKHIGDEIMFSAVDPAAACRVAIELRDRVAATTARPRGGVAYGEVITRHGDYYGPVVNLASRLTDEAIPGEILVPEDLRAAVTDQEFEPAGRRMLKGFEQPVAVYSIASGP